MGITFIDKFLLMSGVLLFQLSVVSAQSHKIDSSKKIRSDKHPEFDLCSETSRFDFRTAYWLAVFSEYSYSSLDVMKSIVMGKPGVTVAEIPSYDKNGKRINKPVNGLGLTTNASDISFYTSPKLKLGEMTSNTENIYTRWVTPLPFEACIRPECWECFSGDSILSYDSENTLACERRCGYKNMKATHTKETLQGILEQLKSHKPLTSEQSAIKNQIDKYVNKFNSMPEYRGKTLEINGVPIWSDPKTAERCEQFETARKVDADTQGYIVETENAILVIFRGTENTDADIKIDLKALEMVPFSSSQNIKGTVHKGFYLSHKALKDFIKKSLEERLQKHPTKSVFIAGHSLGGAIGHLTLGSLLSSKSFAYKPNLKAVYTFGTPRLGDRDFGLDYTQKVREHGVGVYSLMNESDIVPHVPCAGYYHAAAMIYLSTNNETQLSKAEYNPYKLSRFSIFRDPKSCGYWDVVKNIFNLEILLQDHRMGSYLDRLSSLRTQLLNQSVKCANDKSSTNYESIQLPRNIKINYQKLMANVE